MKQKIKKNIYAIITFFLIVILIFLFQNTYNKLLQKKTFENSIMSFAEKNSKKIFSIDKIVFFSSCDSKNKTSSQTNFTIENLYTISDFSFGL